MRPLYLDGLGAKGMEVVLDGPALRVHQPGRADGLYPLRLLSRIVVLGEVRWETEALLQTAEAGIPVVFLGRKGHVRGICLGERVRQTTLGERLEAFLDRPDWQARYRDWYAAGERRAILWTVRRLHLP
ncbi:MAG: DNA repair protein, partial [Gammaproteobacteria bacterium]